MQREWEGGEAGLSAILGFLERAYREGAAAAVPADALPVLVRAGCRPTADGCFFFPRRRSFGGKVPLVERFIAFLLLIGLLPCFLLIARLVACADGFPVIFRQELIGYGGNAFTLYKFRTMRQTARKVRDGMIRKWGESDRVFKLDHDPRVSPVGRLLRRSFLDELPQLLNVVKGEMRLFGPRPLPAYEHAHYHRSDQALRLVGVPGISGLWQVSGRNALSFDEMCLLDYYGLCHQGFWFNLWLLFRTVGTVFREMRT